MTRLRYGVLVLAVLLGGWMVAPTAGQDLNTLLVYFITDLRAGTFSIGTGKDITISSDGDGAVTFTGNGDGSDEAITINLDDTANTAAVSSTTGVVTVNWGSLGHLLPAGSAAAPSLSYTSDATTGWYNDGGPSVSVGGARQLLIDSADAWFLNNIIFDTDGTLDIGRSASFRPRSLYLQSPAITAGSGTGVTVNDGGEVRDLVYKVTVSYTNVVSNAVTHDLTIATLPAKTFIKHILADVTTPYVCAQTCTTASLSGTVGSAAGGNQYLLSFDLDAAAAQFGDADAEFGASLAQATIPTPLGALGSWSATSSVSFRVTSGTGNLATAGVTNLNAGSITFYLTTTKMP